MTTTIDNPHFDIDLNASGKEQARALELLNVRRAFQTALHDLSRIKQRSDASRGNPEANLAAYTRAYGRLEQQARRIFEITGKESEVPMFDPPKPATKEVQTVRVGAPDWLELPEPPPKPAKKIPDHIKVGTAGWYRIQGQTPPAGCPE